ncbi:MAG: cytochrome C oxidase Cbb3 [Planctomycetota bacterium]|nr:MAG: cytochrome C oxidase Cbb3 [Planctomycetota bacterium]
MADQNYDVLREHEFDGIREYDNPTPGWWWMLFIGTILFSVVYFLFFEMSPASWTIQEAHSAAQAELARIKYGKIGELKPDIPTMLQYMNEPEWLAVGATVFRGQCAQCHGPDGAGLVGGGVNLTDDYYKNIKKLDDIPRVIANGAAGGAMPPWKNRLHPNDIVLAACYVATLRGKDLPSPRGHEGEVIPPWPTAEEAAADGSDAAATEQSSATSAPTSAEAEAGP